jgi:hypothetical protein
MEESILTQDTNVEELDFSQAEEEYTDSTEQTEASAQQKDEWGLDVVFNGEKKTLTREEAIANAQKGMNYDHVKSELDKLRAAEKGRQADTDALNAIDQFAQSLGMDRAGYLNFVKQQQREAEINKLMDEGLTKPFAEQLMQERQERLTDKAELEQIRSELSTLKEQNTRREQWSAFFAAHPEIESFDALDDQVKADIAAGDTPEAAYMKWEVKSLREQLAQQKQARKNAETSVGSAKGDGAGAQDAFEAALAAAFRQ